MLARLIAWSARNTLLVLLGSAFLVAAGLYSLWRTPLDAMPDLSDVQVIVYTECPGQAPQLVEDQITYPLDHGDAGGAACEGGARLLVLRAVVRLRDLRGRHRPLLGALARARVPERGRRPPAGGRDANPGPGCDRCRLGVPVRLLDRNRHTLVELRSCRTGICATSSPRCPAWPRSPASAASCSQYQVTVDPNQPAGLRHPGLAGDPTAIARATTTSAARRRDGRHRVHGARPRLSRGSRTCATWRSGPRRHAGAAARRRAVVELGPDKRRGVAELNGEGEVVGGIVVVRYGENALAVITASRPDDRSCGRPARGVEIVTVRPLGSDPPRHRQPEEKLIEEESIVVRWCASSSCSTAARRWSRSSCSRSAC